MTFIDLFKAPYIRAILRRSMPIVSSWVIFATRNIFYSIYKITFKKTRQLKNCDGPLTVATIG